MLIISLVSAAGVRRSSGKLLLNTATFSNIHILYFSKYCFNAAATVVEYVGREEVTVNINHKQMPLRVELSL